jgi:hypothetical protein
MQLKGDVGARAQTHQSIFNDIRINLTQQITVVARGAICECVALTTQDTWQSMSQERRGIQGRKGPEPESPQRSSQKY